jgi:outer membrane protein assembly factor BamB
VLSAIGSLTGLDPATGEILWRLDGLSGNSTPTPVPLGAGRMLVGATDGRGESDAGKNAETNGVVAVTRDAGGRWSAAYEWKASKATCSFGSPMAHRGVAYFINRSGVIQAMDLASGAPLYTERGPGSVWATPVAIDGSVLLFCKDGAMAALAAGPQFAWVAAPVAEAAGDSASTPGAPGDQASEAAGGSPASPAAGPGGPAGPAAQGRTLYGVAVGEDYVLVREGDRLRRFELERRTPR